MDWREDDLQKPYAVVSKVKTSIKMKERSVKVLVATIQVAPNYIVKVMKK